MDGEVRVGEKFGARWVGYDFLHGADPIVAGFELPFVFLSQNKVAAERGVRDRQRSA
ncbi:hypothetical protein D3C80_2121690 [compost metagenome]